MEENKKEEIKEAGIEGKKKGSALLLAGLVLGGVIGFGGGWLAFGRKTAGLLPGQAISGVEVETKATGEKLPVQVVETTGPTGMEMLPEEQAEESLLSPSRERLATRGQEVKVYFLGREKTLLGSFEIDGDPKVRLAWSSGDDLAMAYLRQENGLAVGYLRVVGGDGKLLGLTKLEAGVYSAGSRDTAPEPVWSANGRYLVLQNSYTEELRIYDRRAKLVKVLETGLTSEEEKFETAGHMEYHWSEDGKKIFYRIGYGGFDKEYPYSEVQTGL